MPEIHVVPDGYFPAKLASDPSIQNEIAYIPSNLFTYNIQDENDAQELVQQEVDINVVFLTKQMPTDPNQKTRYFDQIGVEYVEVLDAGAGGPAFRPLV